jgi:flavodoxin
MNNLEVIRTYYTITPTSKWYDGTLRLKVNNIYSVFEIDGGYKVCLTKNLTKRNPSPISKSLDVDRAIEFANYLYELFHK